MISDAGGKSLKKTHKYMTRNKSIPNLPQIKLNAYQKSFLVKSISLYSNLSSKFTSCQNLGRFTNLLKSLCKCKVKISKHS